MSTNRELLMEALKRLVAVRAVELRPALREAADAIAAATGADKVDVFVLEERSGSLVAIGVSDTPLGRRQIALGLDRLPIANGGRTVRVYETGAEFMTGDARTDPEELPGAVGALGVRSSVQVPFDVAGVRRGVLHLCSTRTDAFADEILGFARAVAGWVGVIAHRADAVERLSAEAADSGRRAAAEEIVTVTAHDLRNYIAPVHGRVLLLKQRAIRDGLEPYRRDAEAAERSLQRLTRVVSDLLDVGRIEQGLFEVEPMPLDLASLVREVASALETPAVPIAVRNDSDVVVDGDRVRLAQVVENLLANAAKHAPPGTAIHVDVATVEAENRDWAVVRICDEGPGMDAELAARAFTRFARGSGSKGLGLGLYLAREIVLAHRGTLQLSTAPGRGATFTLRIPAHPR
ncbi:MAG: ATP-binding protein [Anaeromyxobacteraceae bacterium]